jgi:hypothetical protein
MPAVTTTSMSTGRQFDRLHGGHPPPVSVGDLCARPADRLAHPQGRGSCPPMPSGGPTCRYRGVRLIGRRSRLPEPAEARLVQGERSGRVAGNPARRRRSSARTPDSFQQRDNAWRPDSFQQAGSAWGPDNSRRRSGRLWGKGDLPMRDSVQPAPLVGWATEPEPANTAPAARRAAVFSRAG